jgi:hypothetical protein
MGEVLAIATLRIRRDLEARLHDDAEVQALLERVAARELDPASVAAEILARESDLHPRRQAGPQPQATAEPWVGPACLYSLLFQTGRIPALTQPNTDA